MQTIEHEALLLQAQTARDLAQRFRRQAGRTSNEDEQGRLLSKADEFANRARQLEQKAHDL